MKERGGSASDDSITKIPGVNAYRSLILMMIVFSSDNNSSGKLSIMSLLYGLNRVIEM